MLSEKKQSKISSKLRLKLALTERRYQYKRDFWPRIFYGPPAVFSFELAHHFRLLGIAYRLIFKIQASVSYTHLW